MTKTIEEIRQDINSIVSLMEEAENLCAGIGMRQAAAIFPFVAGTFLLSAEDAMGLAEVIKKYCEGIMQRETRKQVQKHLN
jgi:hypothetical protein